jgi:hypothetical protein
MIMAVETTNSAKKSCHGMISFFSSSLLFSFHLSGSIIPIRWGDSRSIEGKDASRAKLNNE